MAGPTAPTRLWMVRRDLDNIPGFEPLPGFGLRWYRPGDEAAWTRIQRAADLYNVITPDLFGRKFGSDPALLAARQCYLLDPGGAPVGTATAWFEELFEGGAWGRVHWVAVLPEYQGRGLAKSLMTCVCRRLRELGHGRACLATAAERVSAIRLYLRFGFEPLIRDPTEAALWSRVGLGGLAGV